MQDSLRDPLNCFKIIPGLLKDLIEDPVSTEDFGRGILGKQMACRIL